MYMRDSRFSTKDGNESFTQLLALTRLLIEVKTQRILLNAQHSNNQQIILLK